MAAIFFGFPAPAAGAFIPYFRRVSFNQILLEIVIIIYKFITSLSFFLCTEKGYFWSLVMYRADNLHQACG